MITLYPTHLSDKIKTCKIFTCVFLSNCKILLNKTPFIAGILFFLSLSVQTVYGQDVNAKEMFVEAESYFLFEDYKDALPLYQKILRLEPENYNVYYKIGICYLNDIYNKQKSIRYLEDACTHINKQYKINSFKEKQAPPEALYYLGVAYRKTSKLNEAIETFGEFLDIADKDLFNIELINEEILSCKYALELKKDELLVEKHNDLGVINSNYAERNPVISGNGKSMVFVRKLPFYEGVFLSTLNDNNEWTEPLNLTEYFGLDGDSYCTGISYKGDEIYVYRSDNFDGNIYASYKKKDEWTTLKKLGENINTKYWESHASPSPDGKYLYFTSNRKGGYGGLDIYKSERLKNGNWGKPENLGSTINSPYNEETPFLTRNGKKLYFSSMGHKSSGGYDIFISEKNNKGNWSKPINLGYPFNTPDDELFYCPAPDDEWGYFAMFDPLLTKGLTDIFYVSVFRDRDLLSADSLSYDKSGADMKLKFSLRGKVKSFNGDEIDYSKIKIYLTDKNGNVIDSAMVNPDGSYGFVVNSGKYNLLLKGVDIEETSVSVTVDSLQTYSKDNIIDFNIKVKGSDVFDDAGVVKASEFTIEKHEIVVSDSKNVNIPLICPKGYKFEIEAYQGDSLLGYISFLARKDNPIFSYKPVPGENTLLFKLVDADSVIKEEIVTIQNYIDMEVPGTDVEISSATYISSQIINDLIQLSDTDIKAYLMNNSLNDDISLQDLINQLYAAVETNTFDSTAIDLLLAMYLTQKGTDEFFSEISSADSSLKQYAQLTDSFNIPLVLVAQMRMDRKDYPFDEEFVKSLNQNFDSVGLIQKYINSFKKYSSNTLQISKLNQSGQEDKTLINSANEGGVRTIDLAVTTQDVNKFYHNLLFNTDETLIDKISAVDFKSEGISNSIDLVLYLLNNSAELGITKGQLAELIYKSNQSQATNIEKFIEMLSENAVGNIKTQLLVLMQNADDFESYTDVIYSLSTNAQTAGYSRKELYKFILDLSGIVSVDDAIQYLKENASDEIIASLDDIPREQMSNALEVFQYLLANTSRYAYEEWDICQVLSQMLLERGIPNLPDDSFGVSERNAILSENTTKIIVLIGIALSMILILFFVMRNKRQKKEE